jgi:hypothetical protein
MMLLMCLSADWRGAGEAIMLPFTSLLISPVSQQATTSVVPGARQL